MWEKTKYGKKICIDGGQSFPFEKKKKGTLGTNMFLYAHGHRPLLNLWDKVPTSLSLRLFYKGQVTDSHSSHSGPALLQTMGINYRCTFSAFYGTYAQMSFCSRS